MSRRFKGKINSRLIKEPKIVESKSAYGKRHSVYSTREMKDNISENYRVI